jgi:hypothetical protein
LRHIATLGNEQAPPPVDVLIVLAELIAKLAVEGWGYVCAVQSSVEVEACSESATAFSARCNCSGNVFPRASARRRMPKQAFWLK